jgi:hypothetical protein
MDKDVLSQCEALIVMGITHNKDRKTIKEWMEAKDIGDRAAAAFDDLGSLKPGEAWYWNPGEDQFEKFTFRKRRTLHPREMKKIGLKPGTIRLGDMQSFVDTAKRGLTKTQLYVPEPGPKKGRPILPEVTLANHEIIDRLTKENEALKVKVQHLHEQLADEKRKSVDANHRLHVVREALAPQYDSLRTLFENLSPAAGPSAAVNRGPFEKWMTKAPKVGIRLMLEHLVENGEATRQQLATIAGVAKSTSYDYVGWILRNQLAQDDGKIISIRKM